MVLLLHLSISNDRRSTGRVKYETPKTNYSSWVRISTIQNGLIPRRGDPHNSPSTLLHLWQRQASRVTLPRWSDLSTTAGPDPWSPDLSNAALHQGLGCNWTASLCVREVHRGDLFRGCVWFFLLRQREVGLEVKDYSDLEASFSKKSIHDLFQAYLTFLVLDSGIFLEKV